MRVSRTRRIRWLCLGLVAGAAPWLTGYLPGGWNEKHAAADPEQADTIVIGRVIKLERLPEPQIEKTGAREIRTDHYRATLEIEERVKGELAAGGTVAIELGYVHRPVAPKGRYWPGPWEIRIANSQLGYDLRLNEAYLLFLSACESEDGRAGYDLRSGPYSLGWIRTHMVSSEMEKGMASRPETTIAFCAIGNAWGEPVPFETYMANLRARIAAVEKGGE